MNFYKMQSRAFDLYSYEELPTGRINEEELPPDLIADLEKVIESSLGQRWDDFEISHIEIKHTRLPHKMDFKDDIHYKGRVYFHPWRAHRGRAG